MASPKKPGKPAAKKTAVPQQAKPKAKAAAVRPSAPAAPKAPAGPTARTCPLVLDGEIDADDFSPSDCLTCEEFDCRFCEAGQGSGALRSRLFAGSEDDGEEMDDWGRDIDFDGGEEGGGEDEGFEDAF